MIEIPIGNVKLVININSFRYNDATALMTFLIKQLEHLPVRLNPQNMLLLLLCKLSTNIRMRLLALEIRAFVIFSSLFLFDTF